MILSSSLLQAFLALAAAQGVQLEVVEAVPAREELDLKAIVASLAPPSFYEHGLPFDARETWEVSLAAGDQSSRSKVRPAAPPRPRQAPSTYG